MGPIRDGQLVEFSSLIENDTEYMYIKNAEGLPPVYIIEGLPGNHYSYDDWNYFKNYTLKHNSTTLGFCEIKLIN